jgi:hypothetical protein
MNHTKPTSEELEANIKKAAEELEKPEVKEEPKTEEPQEETKEEKEEVKEEVKETKEEIDYKKKFVESTREAQILHAKNKKVIESLDKAMSLNEVTEEELQTEYANWDELSEFEQKMAKDSLLNKKRLASLSEITKETKDIETWQGKVSEFISDPKTLTSIPELEGREEEFKLFATKPTRRGVDFDDLVAAFLYDIEKKRPPKQKGAMFESGTGGEKTKPKSDKLSVEEGRKLRLTDYKKYTEYLRAGKIESDL